MSAKVSGKTAGERSIIAPSFLKTRVQCMLVSTKGQYNAGRHLKGYWKQIGKHDSFLGCTPICQGMMGWEMCNYCDKNPLHSLLHILPLKMISSLIKLPFYLLSSKVSRNEHLQRKLSPLDLAWSVVRLHKWGISLQSLV